MNLAAKFNSIAPKIFEKRKIVDLLPVQQACLDPISTGKDVIIESPTGSGKTLAYLLPILNRMEQKPSLQKVVGRSPRVLVIVPHRELALQIKKEFLLFSKSCRVVDTFLKRGDRSLNEQLARGVDVVVGTPTRIYDLRKDSALKLNNVETVVIDEADLMMHYGYVQSLKDMLKKLLIDQTKKDSTDTEPEPKWQTCLFSATLPSWVAEVAQNFMRASPVQLSLNNANHKDAQPAITYLGIPVASKASKFETLKMLLQLFMRQKQLADSNAGPFKALIFVSKRKEAEEIAAVSSIAGMSIGILHGHLDPAYRDATLQQMKLGNLQLVVATDIAARGLDIPDVDLVVQWSPPLQPRLFVHRAGRTGRAGKRGTCVTFYTSADTEDVQVRLLEDIERAAHVNIKRVHVQRNDIVLEQSKALQQFVARDLLHCSSHRNTVFHKAAEQLLSQNAVPSELIARLLARLAGYSTPEYSLPKEFGLLTGREGFVTLHYKFGNWSSFRHSLQSIGVEVWAAIVDELGSTGQGASETSFNKGYRLVRGGGIVMDVSSDLAHRLLELWPESANRPRTLEPCIAELPSLVSLSEHKHGGVLMPTVRKSFELLTHGAEAESLMSTLKTDVAAEKRDFVSSLKKLRKKHNEKRLFKSKLEKYLKEGNASM